MLLLSGCQETPPETRTAVARCGMHGQLVGQLYGSLDAALDWGPEKLQCQGMPRPNNAGARLRFAGKAEMAGQSIPIAFIFGIPDLERGQGGKELRTNVTVIDEGSGRFFATQDIEACWSDIESQQQTAGESEFEIRGILYCVSPLAELHGAGSVRLSEIRFVGQVDWKQPK